MRATAIVDSCLGDRVLGSSGGDGLPCAADERVPEIDPGSITSALTLLCGGVLILTGHGNDRSSPPTDCGLPQDDAIVAVMESGNPAFAIGKKSWLRAGWFQPVWLLLLCGEVIILSLRFDINIPSVANQPSLIVRCCRFLCAHSPGNLRGRPRGRRASRVSSSASGIGQAVSRVGGEAPCARPRCCASADLCGFLLVHRQVHRGYVPIDGPGCPGSSLDELRGGDIGNLGAGGNARRFLVTSFRAVGRSWWPVC